MTTRNGWRGVCVTGQRTILVAHNEIMGVFRFTRANTREVRREKPMAGVGIWKGCGDWGDRHRKIIAARYYYKGFEAEFGPLDTRFNYHSPRDTNGHGTHTTSTAAGRQVVDVSAPGGFAPGTATGGAPLARLAIYKVAWNLDQYENRGSDADIIAAFDDAIGDGVHVLSVSMSSFLPVTYDKDSFSIGALHAVRENIVVAFSAGNEGPDPATVLNEMPWAIIVGANTIDRIFPSAVVLGNLHNIASLTLYTLDQNKLYPLVSGDQVGERNASKNSSSTCQPDSLSPNMTKGKIVFCSGGGENNEFVKGYVVKNAGGLGAIIGNSEADGNQFIYADVHFVPTTSVNYYNDLKILKYIKSTEKSMATIVQPTTLVDSKLLAPIVALFSSRGPGTLSPNIIKPDIVAPGVNILAAFTEASPPGYYHLPGNNGTVKYYIDSGTSMSAPNVAGALALLKAVHNNWSSVALRSALMTTARRLNNQGGPIIDYNGIPANAFQVGSCHFDPNKAVDPGLIYNASHTDYLHFLCNSGYLNLTIPFFQCMPNQTSPASLNCPSLAIPNLTGTVAVVRTVTNVGGRAAVYSANVQPPPGIHMKITPCSLHFTKANQVKKFTITIKPNYRSLPEKGKFVFGWYTLVDGIGHNVHSSIAVLVA